MFSFTIRLQYPSFLRLFYRPSAQDPGHIVEWQTTKPEIRGWFWSNNIPTPVNADRCLCTFISYYYAGTAWSPTVANKAQVGSRSSSKEQLKKRKKKKKGLGLSPTAKKHILPWFRMLNIFFIGCWKSEKSCCPAMNGKGFRCMGHSHCAVTHISGSATSQIVRGAHVPEVLRGEGH